jgi:hypothetical protein
MGASRLQDLGRLLGHPASDRRLASVFVGLAVPRPVFVDQAVAPAEQRLNVRLAVIARVKADQLALFVEIVADLSALAERLDRAPCRQQGELALFLFLLATADAWRRPRCVERVTHRFEAPALRH